MAGIAVEVERPHTRLTTTWRAVASVRSPEAIQTGVLARNADAIETAVDVPSGTVPLARLLIQDRTPQVNRIRDHTSHWVEHSDWELFLDEARGACLGGALAVRARPLASRALSLTRSEITPRAVRQAEGCASEQERILRRVAVNAVRLICILAGSASDVAVLADICG